MAEIQLAGVGVRKGDVEVLRDIDLTVGAGSVLAVLGPTGSGKTSLLRVIAGLDRADRGTVRFDGRDVTELPTEDRDVAFTFQRPALLSGRTVRRNIALPLELRRETIEQIRDRVTAEARALHIEELLDGRPDQLSSGQVQVVQIARSLVRRPQVLLLDEPFGGIDARWRTAIRRELMLIQGGFGVTTVVALDDANDAVTIADRLAVIEAGALVQHGDVADVIDHPRTLDAALLTGAADVMTVEVEPDSVGAWLVAPGLRVRAWQPGVRARAGRRLQMVVRPHWWELDPSGGTVGAMVEGTVALGEPPTATCRVGPHRFSIALRHEQLAQLAPGDAVRLRLARHHLLDPLTGYALDLDGFG